MQIFITRPGGFKEVQRRIIPVMISVYAALFAIVIVVPTIVSDDPGRWTLVPYMLVIFAIVTAFATWSTLKRQRKSFETFKLIVDDEKMVREQYGLPPITISRAAVKKITRNYNGSFTVIGSSQLNAIGVPAQIADYERLERTLSEISAIEVRSRKPLAERLFVPAALTAGLLVSVTTISNNPNVLLISSVLIVLLMGAAMVVIQLSKNVDIKTKRLSWIFLIPIISYVIYIVTILSE